MITEAIIYSTYLRDVVLGAIQAIHDAGALGEAVLPLQRRQREIPMKLLEALPYADPMAQLRNRWGRKHR
jgi:hypothetical protein